MAGMHAPSAYVPGRRRG